MPTKTSGIAVLIGTVGASTGPGQTCITTVDITTSGRGGGLFRRPALTCALAAEPRAAMAIRRDYHIRTHPDGWAVTREGAPGAGSVHSTKSEALAAGGECAKRDKVELVVHRKDGRVPAAPDPAAPTPSSEQSSQW